MRSRTLKRPMFRIGGSSGTGITSGLDRPGYRTGIGPNMADVSGPLVSRPAQNKLTDKITSNVDKKPTGLGLGTIPGFLTSLGLNIASATPTGNIFSTIAGAAKDPFDTFQQAKFAEAKEEREFEREKELQMLKNLDEDDRIQIQKEAQVLADNPESEFFGKYNEALNALAKKKIYGVDFMPGEKREKTIEADAETIRSNMRVNKLVAKRMAAFEYDFDSIQKKNEDLSFDIEDPYWTPGRKTYKEGLTYHDAISGKYFTRDSNAPGGDGVPQGFVEIQINK
jgi:ribosomal protein L21E